MGLSKEERILGALYTLRSLGHELDNETYTYWRDSYSRVKKYVADIEGIVEQMIGMLIQQVETNKAYWFFGARDGFEGLMKDSLSYYPDEPTDFLRTLIDEQIAEDQQYEVTLRQFAHRTGFSKYHGMEELLRWWELWAYIQAILYRVNRYQDDLFSKEFQYQLNRLIAQLQLLHKEIGVDDFVEETLLVKFDIFTEWYSKQLDKRDYTQWHEKADEIAAMTQEAVAKWRRAKWDERDKQNEEHAKKYRPKIDPVHGDTVTVDQRVQEVMDHFSRPYPLRLEVLEALHRMDGDVERAVKSIRAKRAAKSRRKEKK